MDPRALAACLGTRRRPQLGFDLGPSGSPECGTPPFDQDRVGLDLWSWWWEPWPLFDESVLERDVARIERWYRARGFYDARVVSTELDPPVGSSPPREGSSTCGEGEGGDCSVDVTFVIEEGEPVRVASTALRGAEALPAEVRTQLEGAIALRIGERFDEALHEASKAEMRRALEEAGYASATVTGEVKINRERREAYEAFVIEPGLPAVIGRVCVRGYRTVDPETGASTRELPAASLLDVAALEPGSRYRLSALEEAQRSLYALGVLNGVEVSVLRDEGAPSAASDEASGASVRFGREQEVCNAGPDLVPEGSRAVDILVRVSIGRIDRVGLGVGLQAGQALTIGTSATYTDSQDAAQWDLHFSALLEHRNLFDRLVRGRLEVRPRAIFQMPFLNFTPAEPMPFGVQTTGSIQWPAFLERRTNLLVQARHDLGPMPFTNFFRSELDGLVGLDRTFWDGRLYAGVFVHANWFYPTDRQPVEPRLQLPETAAVWVEETVRLDLRDDPGNPTEGAYFSASAQQAVQPLGSWDFVRFTAEARGYVPLPLGMVIAARFELGVMEVLGTSLDPRNVYQLAQLGPPALHLRGGGASSNRGFLPGLLGDVEQVYVPSPRSDAEVASGAPERTRPVRISGGARSWGASIELRVPLTQSFGLVVFGDAGDVDRFRPGDPDAGAAFRFDHPQLSFGLGLRYRTIIGPVRLDVAFRPDELQVIGGNGTLPRECSADSANRCRPTSRIDFFGWFDFPGAFHLTIGEAF